MPIMGPPITTIPVLSGNPPQKSISSLIRVPKGAIIFFGFFSEFPVTVTTRFINGIPFTTALYADKDIFLLRDLGEPWYSNPSYIEDASQSAEEILKHGYEVYLLTRHFYIEGCNIVKDDQYLRISKYTK